MWQSQVERQARGKAASCSGILHGAGWRDGAFPSMPATTFSSSPALGGKDDNITRMRSFLAETQAPDIRIPTGTPKLDK